MPKNSLIFLLFLVSTLGLYSSLLFGEPFSDPGTGFSVVIPEDMLQVHNLPDKGVRLALRAKDRAYPTFNVIFQAFSIDLEEGNHHRLVKQIHDDYLRVGLKDAKVTASSVEALEDESPTLNVELSYSLNDLQLTSFVSLIAGRNRHYILTFIDQSKDFTRSKAQGINIRNSFRVFPINQHQGQIIPPQSGQFDIKTILTTGLIIISLLFIVVFLLRMFK